MRFLSKRSVHNFCIRSYHTSEEYANINAVPKIKNMTTIEEAITLYRTLPKPNYFVFGALLSLAKRLTKTQSVLFLVDDAVKHRIKDSFALHELFRISAAHHDTESASKMWKMISSYKINFMAKNSEFDGLVSLLREEAASMTEQLYNHAILLCLNAHQYQLADRICTQMLECKFVPTDISMARLVEYSCRQNDPKRAYKLIQVLREHHRTISTKTYTVVLAACIKDRRFELANSLIENLNNMSMDVQLASTVIKFYCKTNRLKKAIEFHDKILQAEIVPNEITYTILIAGCIKAGELDVANVLYLEFKSGGKQSLELTNTIIKMHCENGQMDTAMKLFHSMEVAPNSITYLVLITGCIDNKLYSLGEDLISQFIDTRIELTLELSTAIIRLFCASGHVERAIDVFRASTLQPDATIYLVLLNGCLHSEKYVLAYEIYQRVIHSNIDWTLELANTMIKMFCVTNRTKQAVETFDSMVSRDIQPNEVTYNILISGCTNACDYELAADVHSRMVKSGIQLNLELTTTLMKFYCETSNMNTAMDLFRNTKFKPDGVTYLVLIAGCSLRERDLLGQLYQELTEKRIPLTSELCAVLFSSFFAQNEHAKAHQLYRDAIRQGVSLRLDAYAILLSHAFSLPLNFEIERSISSATTRLDQCILILCYGYRGQYELAKNLFEDIEDKDINAWNSNLIVLARGGKGKEAVAAILNMRQHGVGPTDDSYIQGISACSHRYLVTEAEDLYARAQKDGNATDTVATCLVDVYARSGDLDRAEQLAYTIKKKADVAWISVLSGCKQYADYTRGERIMKYVTHLPTSHVLMGNIYAGMSQWEKRAGEREFMEEKKLYRVPGQSMVEVNGEFYTYVVEDSSATEEMKTLLKQLRTNIIEQFGYKADIACILKKITSFDAKVEHLWQHSEKLALAKALLETNSGDILITKNLKMCLDCHNATKMISAVTYRKITISDNKRAHVFQNGVCDCADKY